ncbi:class I SAM-dependent methyltransferase [Kitasatospora gansuensis]
MQEFDMHERRMWGADGVPAAYRRGFAGLCAGAVPALLDRVAAGPGLRLLDVGTGTGTVAAVALARGAAVTAVDAEPQMVKSASERLPEVPVSHALLPELPFADGEFDAVAANFVVNHVADPVAALAELRRVVRPGGRGAVTLWWPPATTRWTCSARCWTRSRWSVRPSRPSRSPSNGPRPAWPDCSPRRAGSRSRPPS